MEEEGSEDPMYQLHSQLQPSEQLTTIPKNMQCTASTPAQSLFSILPLEITVIILRCSPDLATLSAIVHSSAHYHNAYLIAREEILTAVTLRDLEVQRGIRFRKPCHFLTHIVRDGHLQFVYGTYSPSLQPSFQCPMYPYSRKQKD